VEISRHGVRPPTPDNTKAMEIARLKATVCQADHPCPIFLFIPVDWKSQGIIRPDTVSRDKHSAVTG